MKEWTDFFIAMGGAAATLTGLIFVGISINLNRIISLPKLPSRASQALILLVTVLVICALCLVPNQTACIIGCEFLFIGIFIWVISFKLDLKIWHQTDKQYKYKFLLNALLTQLSVLPYILSGIVLLCCGYVGLYWLIPGIIFSFIKAVLDGWVLLVEINR
ncbi:MAG TPA: hypothetical protein VK808_03515 [Bacteroidia bacterium]|jgi:hypothetical protein|nr:hypothetical protein [Bacteroidia bacterium]